MTARCAAAYGSPVSVIRRRAAALILSFDIVPSFRQPVPAPGHRRVVTMEGETHARALPLLSSAVIPAPGWPNSDRAGVSAITKDTLVSARTAGDVSACISSRAAACA